MRLDLDPTDLEPLVDAIATRLAERLSTDATGFGEGRIGLTESEAAAAIGLARHQLRDSRYRGEITAKKVGRNYVYAVEELRRFLRNES